MLLYHYIDKIMEIFLNENIGFYTKDYTYFRQINKNKFKKGQNSKYTVLFINHDFSVHNRNFAKKKKEHKSKKILLIFF